MTETDLIFSLGPNCRTTWNLRDYYGLDRAYPFDWWVVPVKSMLKMITPGFRFHVDREDLHISPTDEHNSVYNYKLNLRHHHDFPRQWGHLPGIVFSVSDEDIAQTNLKYRQLFSRLAEDLKHSSNPIAVIHGCARLGDENPDYAGFEAEYKGIPTNPDLNGFVPHADAAREVRERLGRKLRLAFISVGEAAFEEHDWGWDICLPDLGAREHIKDAPYAEPIHVFRQAYQQLGIRLKDGGSGAVAPPANGAASRRIA